MTKGVGVLKPDGCKYEGPGCPCLKRRGPAAVAAADAAADAADAAELSPRRISWNVSPLVHSIEGVLFVSSICAMMRNSS